MFYKIVKGLSCFYEIYIYVWKDFLGFQILVLKLPYSSKRLPSKPLWEKVWYSRKGSALEAEHLGTINTSLLGGTTLGNSLK